jgi:hypothetical protein
VEIFNELVCAKLRSQINHKEKGYLKREKHLGKIGIPV